MASFGGQQPRECIFWLKGYCRDGDACRFAHIPGRKGTDPSAGNTSYNRTQLNGPPPKPIDPKGPSFNIVTLKTDLEEIAHHQWQFSSYAPGKEDTILENLDISPEEARLEYYRCTRMPGASAQTAAGFEAWWNQINQIKAKTLDTAHRQLPRVLAEATRRYNQARQIPDSAVPSRFGPGFTEPPMPPSALGFSMMGAAQPQPVAQSAFGPGGSGPAQSTFGQPQPAGFGQSQPAGFGQPQPAGFGQSQPAGFGQSQPAGFGQPAPAPYQSPFGPGGTGMATQAQQPPAPSAPASWGAPAVQSAFGPGGSGPAYQSAFGPGGSGMPVQSAFGPGGSGMAVQSAFGPGGSGPAQPQQQQWGSTSQGFGAPVIQSAFGPGGSGMAGQAQQQPRPFAVQSAFGPGGSGLPAAQQAQPQTFGQPVPPTSNTFGMPAAPQPAPSSATAGYTRKKRPVCPAFLNPFPGQAPRTSFAPHALDTTAGSALPLELRNTYRRPIIPQTQFARERLARQWAEVPEDLRRLCEEAWKADKFDIWKIPGLPPPPEFR